MFGLIRWGRGVLLVVLLSVAGMTVQSTSAVARHGSNEEAVGRALRSDSAPPTVSITTPVANATIGGTLTIAGTASDDVGLVKVKYRVDRKGNFVQAAGTTNWSGSVNVTSHRDGAAVIWIRAVDTSGNVGEASVAVNISNGATPAPSPDPSPDPSPPPPPPNTGGATAWGIYSSSQGSISAQDSNNSLASLVGRTFGGQRIYTNMTDTFPSSADIVVAGQGGVIYHNINSFYLDASGNKVCRPWSEDAAGVNDPWWIAQAQAIKAFGYPVLLSFNHEPTVDAPVHPLCGTATEFRAAYDHYVQLFAAQGVTNVTWVWTLTASTFNGQHGGAAAWEPSHYDIIGVDGYSRAASWRSPQEIFQAAEDFAKLRGKPLLVGEIGCEEKPGDPNGKATWITQAAAMFKSFGDVRAIMWTNDTPYTLNSSPQSLAAFASAGRDPYFGG